MLRHVFIMLWNQRKNYLILLFEQILLFIALALSLVITFDTVRKYRSPGLLDIENVVGFGYMANRFVPEQFQSTIQAMDAIKEKLEKKPYVIGISESLSFIPFFRESEYYWTDSVAFVSGNKIYVHTKIADAAAEKVFRPDIIKGRWFRDMETLENNRYPAVISAQLAEAAGLSNPVGTELYYGGMPFTVIGMVSGIKEQALEDSPPSIIVPFELMLPYGSPGQYEELAARIKPGYEDEFVNDCYHEFNLIWDKDIEGEFYATLLSKGKNSYMESEIFSIVATGIPAAFFLLFTLIGTAGLNLMDIQERRREFALRISCGSTRRGAMSLMLVQSLLLTGLSVIPGVVIVLATYPISTSLPVAICILILAMLMSILCALYPAFSILKINPAVLLKDE